MYVGYRLVTWPYRVIALCPTLTAAPQPTNNTLHAPPTSLLLIHLQLSAILLLSLLDFRTFIPATGWPCHAAAKEYRRHGCRRHGSRPRWGTARWQSQDDQEGDAEDVSPNVSPRCFVFLRLPALQYVYFTLRKCGISCVTIIALDTPYFALFCPAQIPEACDGRSSNTLTCCVYILVGYQNAPCKVLCFPSVACSTIWYLTIGCVMPCTPCAVFWQTCTSNGISLFSLIQPLYYL